MKEPSAIFYLAMLTMTAAFAFAAWQRRSVAKVRSSTAPARHNREDTE